VKKLRNPNANDIRRAPFIACHGSVVSLIHARIPPGPGRPLAKREDLAHRHAAEELRDSSRVLQAQPKES